MRKAETGRGWGARGDVRKQVDLNSPARRDQDGAMEGQSLAGVGVGGVRACLVRTHAGLCMLRGEVGGGDKVGGQESEVGRRRV